MCVSASVSACVRACVWACVCERARVWRWDLSARTFMHVCLISSPFPPFLHPPLYQRIAYAKTKSDVVAKADGSFVPREKRKRHEERGTRAWLLTMAGKQKLQASACCAVHQPCLVAPVFVQLTPCCARCLHLPRSSSQVGAAACWRRTSEGCRGWRCKWRS